MLRPLPVQVFFEAISPYIQDSIADANLNTADGFFEFIQSVQANVTANLDDPNFVVSR